MSCTGYQLGDWREYYDKNPGGCHCPICGGFLKWRNNEPVCNKCKTPLIKLPDNDHEYEGWGRICPLSIISKEQRTPK